MRPTVQNSITRLTTGNAVVRPAATTTPTARHSPRRPTGRRNGTRQTSARRNATRQTTPWQPATRRDGTRQTGGRRIAAQQTLSRQTAPRRTTVREQYRCMRALERRMLCQRILCHNDQRGRDRDGPAHAELGKQKVWG